MKTSKFAIVHIVCHGSLNFFQNHSTVTYPTMDPYFIIRATDVAVLFNVLIANSLLSLSVMLSDFTIKKHQKVQMEAVNNWKSIKEWQKVTCDNCKYVKKFKWKLVRPKLKIDEVVVIKVTCDKYKYIYVCHTCKRILHRNFARTEIALNLTYFTWLIIIFGKIFLL